MADILSVCKAETDLTGNFFRPIVRGMKTASEIVQFIDRDRLRAALQVKPDAIRKALVKGKLPAAWYHVCEQLAGRPLPRDAFSFKGVTE